MQSNSFVPCYPKIAVQHYLHRHCVNIYVNTTACIYTQLLGWVYDRVYGRIILYSEPDEKAKRKVSGDPDCLKKSPASKMVTQGFCSCNTQTFHFLLNLCNSHVVPVSYLIGTTGQIPKCNILCIFFRKIIAKIKKTSPLTPPPPPNKRWRECEMEESSSL